MTDVIREALMRETHAEVDLLLRSNGLSVLECFAVLTTLIAHRLIHDDDDDARRTAFQLSSVVMRSRRQILEKR